MTKLFGKSESAPVLPVTASKFGGKPYAEEDEDWSGWEFLGQIDLAEATGSLTDTPLKGLLRIDRSDAPLNEGFRLRWFSNPSESKAITSSVVQSVGNWEARLEFNAGWSLPHGEREWFSLLPKELDDLWDFYALGLTVMTGDIRSNWKK